MNTKLTLQTYKRTRQPGRRLPSHPRTTWSRIQYHRRWHRRSTWTPDHHWRGTFLFPETIQCQWCRRWQSSGLDERRDCARACRQRHGGHHCRCLYYSGPLTGWGIYWRDHYCGHGMISGTASRCRRRPCWAVQAVSKVYCRTTLLGNRLIEVSGKKPGCSRVILT